MFLQAAVVVSGAIPLYLIGKEKLQSQFLGLAISLAYLSFGGLQFGFAYGFHEIMLFPPLFFWTYYFYVKKRLVPYFVLVVLSLAVKEEASFIMVFWGLYLLIKRNFKYAIGTIALGVLWYLLCFNSIFPHFNQGGDFIYWAQYPGKNSGLLGLVNIIFTQPLSFLNTLITPEYKISTIFHSFGQFSFLSFLYPPSLVIVIPPLMQKLLNNSIAAKNGFHYSAAIAAVVIVSTIESISNIRPKGILKKMFTNENRNIFLGLTIISVALMANILYGYHPLSPLHLGREKGLTDSELLVLNQTLESIPDGTTIAAQYYIRPHIIDRPFVKVLPSSQIADSDYVIVNTGLPLIMDEQQSLEEDFKQLVKSNQYETVVNSQDTILMKKRI